MSATATLPACAYCGCDRVDVAVADHGITDPVCCENLVEDMEDYR